MNRNFHSVMPPRPIAQKHGDPKHEDSPEFLASLVAGAGADVNARVVWNNHRIHTKASGCHIFAFHGETAASNGFTHRVVNGHTRLMSGHDLHRDIRTWDAHEVFSWRRGRTSHKPVTLNTLYGFVHREGGTIIGELKAREFRFHWIMQQLVADAHRHDQPPWFKALANMAFLQEKAEATAAAEIAGVNGQMAIIFGKHVHGRGARLTAGNKIVRAWPADLRRATRIW